MLTTKSEILAYIRKVYYVDSFTYNCGNRIIDLDCGRAVVGLDVEQGRHTNHVNTAHGGLLYELLDNASGTCCATLGKKVITVSANVSFIKTAPVGHHIEAVAELVHREGKLLHVKAEVYDRTDNQLLLTGQSVMFSVTNYPEIPEKW